MQGEVMKSLVRWGTTLGLVGSTLLATICSGNIPALALPEKEIQEKLNQVPVFLLTDSQGSPLTRPIPKEQNGKQGGSVTEVFMSPQEAQAVLNKLKTSQGKDPKMAEIMKQLQVTPLPLGLIYQQLQQTKNESNRLLFAFNPVEQEVKGAMDLIKASGQKQELRSVPVFAVRFAPDKGYVPATRSGDKKEVIPLYLSKKEALDFLNKQVKPKFPKADIQVLQVDQVIAQLEQKNDAWLNNVVFVPSSEAVNYLQSLAKKSSPTPTAKPAAKPKR
jgi:hypothetical protein